MHQVLRSLQAANGRGYSDIVALLIKYGAEIAPATKEEATKVTVRPLHDAKRSKAPHNLWSTSITVAAGSGDTDVMRTSSPPVRAPKSASTTVSKMLAARNARLMRRGSPGEGAGARLSIVLPQEQVRLASMPLSPSALGFATTRRLPGASALLAKSLDKEIMFRRNTPSPRSSVGTPPTTRSTPTLVRNTPTPTRSTPSPATSDKSDSRPPQAPTTTISASTSTKTPSSLPPLTFAVPGALHTSLATGESLMQLASSIDAEIVRKRGKVVDFDGKMTSATVSRPVKFIRVRADSPVAVGLRPLLSPTSSHSNSPQPDAASKTNSATASDVKTSQAPASPHLQTDTAEKMEVTAADVSDASDAERRDSRRETMESDSSVELSQGLLESLDASSEPKRSPRASPAAVKTPEASDDVSAATPTA